MVTKSRKPSPGKKKKVKVLSLKKETIKNLTGTEAKRVRGGTVNLTLDCSARGPGGPCPTTEGSDFGGPGPLGPPKVVNNLGPIVFTTKCK